MQTLEKVLENSNPPAARVYKTSEFTQTLSSVFIPGPGKGGGGVILDFNTLSGTKSHILTLKGTTITPIIFIRETSRGGEGFH